MIKITGIHTTMKKDEVDKINNLSNPNIWAEITNTFVCKNQLYAEVNLFIQTDEREVKKCQ